MSCNVLVYNFYDIIFVLIDTYLTSERGYNYVAEEKKSEKKRNPIGILPENLSTTHSNSVIPVEHMVWICTLV